MRTIGIGLYAEGPTDQRYLGSVLRRATEMAIREATDESVDVQEILPLDPPRGEKRLAERVVRPRAPCTCRSAT